MVSPKEIIKELRKAFQEITEAKMMEAKSADGAILNIEPALEQGAKVMVVSEEGKTPVANGELKLDDGTVLVCEGGVIVEIKPAEKEEEKKEEDPAKGQAPNEMESKFTAEIESLKSLFEKISARLDAIEQGSAASKSEMASMKKFNSELLSVVESIAGESTQEPAEKPKQGFSMIKEARKAYAAELKNLRK